MWDDESEVCRSPSPGAADPVNRVDPDNAAAAAAAARVKLKSAPSLPPVVQQRRFQVRLLLHLRDLIWVFARTFAVISLPDLRQRCSDAGGALSDNQSVLVCSGYPSFPLPLRWHLRPFNLGSPLPLVRIGN